MRTTKYKVGDKFRTLVDTRTIRTASEDGYQFTYHELEGDGMGHAYWTDDEVDGWTLIEPAQTVAVTSFKGDGGYHETYPLIPEVIPVPKEDPMDPIVSMLITTNLASRLGLPEPYEVDMEWDSPEYLLWILYRADALAPKEPK